ncbi:hypothetical protein BJ912DRAFT_1140795 [Pholiota molesta]|nr:hypothetical protein BJ912DRAFT_1140795 [Pholiota molesta]
MCYLTTAAPRGPQLSCPLLSSHRPAPKHPPPGPGRQVRGAPSPAPAAGLRCLATTRSAGGAGLELKPEFGCAEVFDAGVLAALFAFALGDTAVKLGGSAVRDIVLCIEIDIIHDNNGEAWRYTTWFKHTFVQINFAWFKSWL